MCVAARPAGPFVAAPDRHCPRARGAWCRVPVVAGVDRYHHPGGRLVFHFFASLAEFSVIWTRRDARLPDARAAA